MQKVPTFPAYLIPACGDGKAGLCRGCAEPVNESLERRWYITMGHAGFNSPANNRSGYATKAAAIAAHRKYAGK